MWEFKPVEMKGALNDERKNAKMSTGDSRNRKENYRLPPAHPFKESLCLQVGNAARQRWKIWKQLQEVGQQIQTILRCEAFSKHCTVQEHLMK